MRTRTCPHAIDTSCRCAEDRKYRLLIGLHLRSFVLGERTCGIFPGSADFVLPAEDLDEATNSASNSLVKVQGAARWLGRRTGWSITSACPYCKQGHNHNGGDFYETIRAVRHCTEMLHTILMVDRHGLVHRNMYLINVGSAAKDATVGCALEPPQPQCLHLLASPRCMAL